MNTFFPNPHLLNGIDVLLYQIMNASGLNPDTSPPRACMPDVCLSVQTVHKMVCLMATLHSGQVVNNPPHNTPCPHISAFQLS